MTYVRSEFSNVPFIVYRPAAQRDTATHVYGCEQLLVDHSEARNISHLNQ